MDARSESNWFEVNGGRAGKFSADETAADAVWVQRDEQGRVTLQVVVPAKGWQSHDYRYDDLAREAA